MGYRRALTAGRLAGGQGASEGLGSVAGVGLLLCVGCLAGPLGTAQSDCDISCQPESSPGRGSCKGGPTQAIPRDFCNQLFICTLEFRST